MIDNKEQLKYKLKCLEERGNALLEEEQRIVARLNKAKEDGVDTTFIIQELKDNLSNSQALLDEYQQTYNDFLNVSK